MSTDPPENDDEPIEEIEDGEELEDEEELDEETEDEETEDEETEDEEEEFSLDQLSQAYAEVLKSRPGEDGDAERVDSTAAVETPAAAEESDDDPAPVSDDNAACPISPDSIIESILFVGAPKGVVLNSRKVAAVLRDVSPKEVTKIVRELNARYEKEDAAFRIESDGGVFKMVLNPKLNDFQQDFFGKNKKFALSQTAIDVMAVVAYNQPATKKQIENIRKRPCGGVLNQLIKRELLSVEKGEADPKIKYYSTTDRFLDLFGLEELADLPQSHEVSDIDELAD